MTYNFLLVETKAPQPQPSPKKSAQTSEPESNEDYDIILQNITLIIHTSHACHTTICRLKSAHTTICVRAAIFRGQRTY